MPALDLLKTEIPDSTDPHRSRTVAHIFSKHLGGTVVLNVNSPIIAASAATEASISAGMASATSAAAAALTAVLPMGTDLDSVEFAAALNAAGAAYIGAATEHLTSRGMFAGAQDVAAATYTAADVVNNTALSL